MQFVVSRFKEDIEWTNDLSNVVIYNKGESLPKKYNEIKLDNVGREAHTYYHHIYNNYDNLADYTIFLQGDPFDHCVNLINKVNEFRNMINKPNFIFLSDLIYPTDLSIEQMYDHNNKLCHLPIQKVYNYLYNVYQIYNISFHYGVGAQFIVSKERIREKPREFYLKLIKILDYTNSPIEGYVLERLHGYIFKYNT